MTNTEGNKISQPHITAQGSNAEYIYIIEDKEVWFIDYIIGVAFKTSWRYSCSQSSFLVFGQSPPKTLDPFKIVVESVRTLGNGLDSFDV